jgi:hypothetical protein
VVVDVQVARVDLLPDTWVALQAALVDLAQVDFLELAVLQVLAVVPPAQLAERPIVLRSPDGSTTEREASTLSSSIRLVELFRSRQSVLTTDV